MSIPTEAAKREFSDELSDFLAFVEKAKQFASESGYRIVAKQLDQDYAYGYESVFTIVLKRADSESDSFCTIEVMDSETQQQRWGS